MSVIAGYRIKWYKALLNGIFISAIIEVISQLIFMRGLFEWDDMIRVGRGCMIGCCIMNRIIKIIYKDSV